ncbi:hypothetical protein [Streptomyces bacillaris]|uniref:hypothetical protein n=1 Tax=Streptomyces bacillaris TaxID=68179 RepID=UPI003804C086
MTNISKSQMRREAAETLLWETSTPKLSPAVKRIFELADEDHALAVGNASDPGSRGDGSKLPDLGVLEPFGTWESVASTILHKTASLSDFNQASTNFNAVAWEAYLHKFATIPYLGSYTSDRREARISSTSLAKAVDAVGDLVQSFMTPENYAGVVTTIKKIGQLAVDNKNQMQTHSNQQVGVLSHFDGRLQVACIRTEVSMTYKQNQGFEQVQQTIEIYRGYGHLDFDKCQRNSASLFSYDGQDVDEWVGETPSSKKPPNDCPAWNN